MQELISEHAEIPKECHLALGFYMGEWSALELATGYLAATIFGTEEFLGHLLADKLQPSQLREILSLAASNYMKATDYELLERLNTRWKDASGVRNKMVHGQWRLNIALTEPITHFYTRFSHIWDRATAHREAVPSDQKSNTLRAKYVYTAERITEEGKKVRDLAYDIQSFSAACILRRQPDALGPSPQTAEPHQKSETDLPQKSTTTLNVQHIRGW